MRLVVQDNIVSDGNDEGQEIDRWKQEKQFFKHMCHRVFVPVDLPSQHASFLPRQIRNQGRAI